VAVSLLLGTRFFEVVGSLSGKIGRRPVILAGMALAVLTYVPLLSALTGAANPELAKA
jgi:MFS family permease